MILQQTDVPKLATIILIVLAASLLGLLGVIAGEAVIALFSGIALFAAAKLSRLTKADIIVAGERTSAYGCRPEARD